MSYTSAQLSGETLPKNITAGSAQYSSIWLGTYYDFVLHWKERSFSKKEGFGELLQNTVSDLAKLSTMKETINKVVAKG
jgi:hypothetical protein